MNIKVSSAKLRPFCPGRRAKVTSNTHLLICVAKSQNVNTIECRIRSTSPDSFQMKCIPSMDGVCGFDLYVSDMSIKSIFIHKSPFENVICIILSSCFNLKLLPVDWNISYWCNVFYSNDSWMVDFRILPPEHDNNAGFGFLLIVWTSHLKKKFNCR